MTTSTRNLHQGKLKPRQLEALAFYLGAHDNDPAPVLEEIEARFAQETSEEKQEPLRKLHALEAKLQQVRKEKPEAEALWQRIRKELGDTPPPYFQAFVLACCAFFALALDCSRNRSGQSILKQFITTTFNGMAATLSIQSS